MHSLFTLYTAVPEDLKTVSQTVQMFCVGDTLYITGSHVLRYQIPAERVIQKLLQVGECGKAVDMTN